MNQEEKREFLLRRLEDNSKVMKEEFNKLENEFLLIISSDEENEELLESLKTPLQEEKNLLIFYHLLGLCRVLIKKFAHKSISTEYIRVFANKIDQISIFEYVKVYDEFEVRANKLNKIIDDIKIFKEITNRNNLMNSLNHVENELSSRVNIVHNLIYENQHQNENYVPIIFTFKRIKRKIDNKRPFSMWINEMDIDATLTKKEIEELASFLENAPNNLYEFFYSEYLANNNKIRNLLQEYYINKQLIDQTLGNEYNPELCEMIEYRGVKIPPQDRKIILPSDGDEHNSSNLQGGQSGRGGSHVPGGH